MVLSVHLVEFTPFGPGQRPEDGMGCQKLAAVETGFGFRNHAVHPLNVLQHF